MYIFLLYFPSFFSKEKGCHVFFNKQKKTYKDGLMHFDQ